MKIKNRKENRITETIRSKTDCRLTAIFMSIAILSSALLCACGSSKNAGNPENGSETVASETAAGNASENSVSGDGSDGVTSGNDNGENAGQTDENREAEKTEILFDSPADGMEGLYQADTSFLQRDDYVQEAEIIDGLMALYTENYNGGDNSLWLFDPYTGELLDQVDYGKKTMSVQMTDCGICAMNRSKGSVDVYKVDAEAGKLEGLSIMNDEGSLSSWKASQDLSVLYGINEDDNIIFSMNLTTGDCTQVLTNCTPDLLADEKITGTGENWILLENQNDGSCEFFSLSENASIEKFTDISIEMQGCGTGSAGICSINGRNYLCVGDDQAGNLQVIIPQESEENDFLTGISAEGKYLMNCETVYNPSGSDVLTAGYICRIYSAAEGKCKGTITCSAPVYAAGNQYLPEILCYDEERNVCFLIGYGDGYSVLAWQAADAENGAAEMEEAEKTGEAAKAEEAEKTGEAAKEAVETEEAGGAEDLKETKETEETAKAEEAAERGEDTEEAEEAAETAELTAEMSAYEPLISGFYPVRDAAEASDEDLNWLREKAQVLYDKYEAVFRMGEDEEIIANEYVAYDCNPLEIAAALNLFDKEFSRYPKEMLNQIDDCYGESFEIKLVGTMTEDSYGGTLPSSIAGSAGMNGMMVDIHSDVLRQTINHELFHILEWHLMITYPDYLSDWMKTLPTDFEYSHNYSQQNNPMTIASSGSDPDQVWFIDDYATTNAAEDMARTFEYAMLEKETGSLHLEDYPNLNNKRKVISSMLRKGFDTENWPEETDWEYETE